MLLIYNKTSAINSHSFVIFSAYFYSDRKLINQLINQPRNQLPNKINQLIKQSKKNFFILSSLFI